MAYSGGVAVPAGEAKQVLAVCPEGMRATGGGFNLSAGQPYLQVLNSMPYSEGGDAPATGWSLLVANPGGFGKTAQAYVVCLEASFVD